MIAGIRVSHSRAGTCKNWVGEVELIIIFLFLTNHRLESLKTWSIKTLVQSL